VRRRDSLLIDGCISIGAIPLIFAVANAADVQLSSTLSTQFRLIPQTPNLSGLRSRAMARIEIQLAGQQRRLRTRDRGLPPAEHSPLAQCPWLIPW
jgi:hypothetical protein